MALMPAAGDIVDDVFRVEEEIDSGNFGAVYKVRDLLEHRTLALKVLKPGPHDENELRQRFEREASLIYSLRHPHVVQVYYYGQTESGLPYMAMEYLQGTDLRSLLQHHGALSEALARRITIEALAALHAAHATGIVHRDLKPANIFLVNDGDRGQVKVLDFGFAKALDGDTDFEITNAGTLVGTPAYMSPELVHKKNVGPQADIYALGLILAEMLTGEKVVNIENVYDTIVFQGSKKDIKLPRELRRSVFAPILERAIAKDLDRRYPSAIEMIDALRALNLEGVGPYTDDVPLTSAPPSTGTADQQAHTRPRSDGRPSLVEVDQALANASAQHLVLESEPTVDYPRNTQPQLQPRQAGYRPTAQMPAISRSSTATMATALPEEPAEEGRSAWVDIALGLVIGGVALGAILFFFT
ncbi:serine/threonine protein kinase [Lujinxingia vulgaris]|uniref:Serine/threonine protein kinase n=1 Tax=Lujinxingia vulgaris TaxID=2600176 RepID=A0A5C6X5W7_9DELT|nr:serine/threonine-protein kinase [Lujinxingia vulgaris]TXD31981.1 serine/threonine protein kinase [Lujinxingia vulgaris]